MFVEKLDKIKRELLNLVSDEEHDLKKEIDKIKRPEDALRVMRNYKKKLSLRSEISGIQPSIAKNLMRLRAIYIDLYKDELQEKMLDEHTKQISKESSEAIAKMHEELEEYREDLAEWNEEFQSEFGELLRKMQEDNEDLKKLEEGLEQDKKGVKELDQQIEQEQERLLSSSELQEQDNKLSHELDQMLNKSEQPRVIEQALGKGEETSREALSRREQVLGQALPKPVMEQTKLEEKAQGKKADLDKQSEQLMQDAQIRSAMEQPQAAAPKPEPKPILRDAIKKTLKINGISSVASMGVSDLQKSKHDFFKNVIAQIKSDLGSDNFRNMDEYFSKGAIFQQLEKSFDRLFQMDDKKKKLELGIEEKTKKFEEKIKSLLSSESKDPGKLAKFIFGDQLGKQVSKTATQSVTSSSDTEYKSPTPFSTKLKMIEE